MFPLTSEELHSILSEALSRGGKYADIFMENTIVSNMELQDGIVSQCQQAILYGAGIRSVKGARTGYAYTMDLSMKAMLDAARFAGSMQGKTLGTPIPSLQETPLLHPDVAQADAMSIKNLLIQIDQKARTLSPYVTKVKAAISQRIQNVRFVCSDGTGFTDCRPRTTLYLNIVMERDGQTQMGNANRMMQMGAEMLSEELTEEVVNEAVKKADFLFKARQMEGGEMPVVMVAGGSGILLHEAIGHAFEADFIRTGESIFSEQMGKEICSPDITIVDDGTMPGDAGCLRFDDEGTPGQRTVLVENGRLRNFLYDRISARHFSTQPTGNGRRESFRHHPIPRMRSTYMLSGNAVEEDIIRSVKRGIYAQTFTNGQVQIGSGDFTFFMKTGYLIEDGQLTVPLRDMNIIGNGPQALREISMVANNLRIDHSAGMCGKGGQHVPVSQGLPTVLINRLVVG